jgi:hypothetical protein
VIRRLGVWWCCVALALVALRAHAADADRAEASPAASRGAIVFVRAAAGTSDAKRHDGTEAQLRELSVQVVSAEPMPNLTLASQAFRAAELARRHRALGTIWFGEDHAARLRVYVYDAKHGQLTSRTLAPADAAAEEEVAVVLRSAISALVAGEATQLEPVTLPRPAPAPAAAATPASRERSGRLLAGAGYVATTYTSGTVQSGLQLLLAGRPSSHTLIGLDVIWFQSATLGGGGAEATLNRYPLELFGGFAFASSPRFLAYLETALQLELVRRRTQIEDSRLLPTPAQTRLRFAVAPRLRTVFEPLTGLLGFAAFGADITTDRYDYVVQSAGGPIRLAARSVRPRLEAGVAGRFW